MLYYKRIILRGGVCVVGVVCLWMGVWVGGVRNLDFVDTGSNLTQPEKSGYSGSQVKRNNQIQVLG